MAHAQHERIDTYLSYRTREGYKVGTHILGLSKVVTREDYEREATRQIERGATECEIVTERVTWKGENGKRKRETINTEPVFAEQEDATE